MSPGTITLVAAVLVACTAPAAAHETASSSFEARPAVSAAGPGLQVVFRLDATSVFDMTGATGGPVVLAYLDRRFTVSKGGAPCPREAPRKLGHDPAAKAVVIDVIYRCGGQVTIESTLFHDELIPHTMIGTVRRAGRADRHFFTRGERRVIVDVEAPSRGAFRTAAPPPGAFDGAARPSAPASGGRSLLDAGLGFLVVLAGFAAFTSVRCRRNRRPGTRSPPAP